MGRRGTMTDTMTYRELLERKKKFHEIYNHDKTVFVGMFLQHAEDAFETAFSVFGLFIHFSKELNWPTTKILLPTVSYVCIASEFNNGFPEGLHRGSRLVSYFEINWDTYSANPVNFLAILLNYFARNLGKMIGWAIVSPITIPTYLVIKTIYGIKKALIEERFNDALRKREPQEFIKVLAQAWHEHGYNSLEVALEINRIAQYVDAANFSFHLLKKDVEQEQPIAEVMQEDDWLIKTEVEPDETKVKQEEQPIRIEVENFRKFKKYKRAREKFLDGEERESLVKTILSGFSIIPLFFTIPSYFKIISHLKLVQKQESEKNLLKKHSNIFERLSEKNSGKEEIETVLIEEPKNPSRIEISSSTRTDNTGKVSSPPYHSNLVKRVTNGAVSMLNTLFSIKRSGVREMEERLIKEKPSSSYSIGRSFSRTV